MTKKKEQKKDRAQEKNEQNIKQEVGHNENTAADAVEPELTPNADDQFAELESLRAEAVENLDKFMRAKAETENVRRRAETDVVNARKFAIEKFAAEILIIRDSLEMARGMDLKEGSQDVLEKMHEGMDLTLKQFDATFEKFQMEMVNPHGEKFNPDLHQAISMIESPEVTANHIISVVQKGCTIGERLLRPALVVVSNGNGKQQDSEKDKNGEESAKNEANSS